MATGPLLEYSDPRVRAIPFPTGRPTLKEITRTYARLVSLEPSAEEPKALREQRLQVGGWPMDDYFCYGARSSMSFFSLRLLRGSIGRGSSRCGNKQSNCVGWRRVGP